MFRFSHPEYFVYLAVVPIILGLYFYAVYSGKKKLSAFGNLNLIRQLMPIASFRRGWIKTIIVLLAISLIIVGLAGPQFGSKLTEVKRKGIELIIVLDVSNSMLAQDIQPSRIERAKQAISRLVDQLTSDRIGLIVFAGDAYVQLPVTNDYVSAKMFLSSIHPGMVPKQGTAIGTAINLAVNSFSQQEEAKKVIVVISDGENHEDNPVDAAKKASEKGIVIHAIGIGSQQGAPIPMPSRRGSADFLRDKDGNVVVTKLDEETLSKVAVSGGGKYVKATNSQLGLLPLFEEINRMERAEFKDKVYSDYDDQFQYLFIMALVLLVVDFFVLERKNRWIQKLNLFGGNRS